MSAERCHILGLPTELRLHIYDYALCDSEAITISSAQVSNASDATVNYSDKYKASVLGLPPNHVPVIRRYYDPSLLSISHPPMLKSPTSASRLPPTRSFADSAYASASSLAQIADPSDQAEDWSDVFSCDTDLLSTSHALLSTCRTINAELCSHLQYRRHKSQPGPALYISYPTGVLVLKSLCPHLLTQARAIYISGAHNAPEPLAPSSFRRNYTPVRAEDDAPSSAPKRRRTSTSRPDHPPVPLLPSPVPSAAATAALTSLTCTLFGSTVHPTLQKLQLRIYYPSGNSYHNVWGDDSSPIVVALQHTHGGEIDSEVWRGRWGTGVKMDVRTNVSSRVVSTVWRRLPDSKVEGEGFVIGGEWPERGEDLGRDGEKKEDATIVRCRMGQR